ncbi:MAG: GNAT family N-acetyltransferase [Betaproteobacteria bacterium]|nr:GNAT family N-acetyltransferase [Betaproteobacteria bacterium]
MPNVPPEVSIRPIAPQDYEQWRPLWDGYNAFYGRQGETALPETITEATWDRFFSSTEPVYALVAVKGSSIEAVYAAARAKGSTRVYWQTQASNTAGRALYDKVARHAGFIVYSHEL